MADIKTNLRELSVAVTVGLLAMEIKFSLEELYDSKYFFDAVEKIVKNDRHFLDAVKIKKFNSELCQIIKNGYNLGKKIYNSDEFDINSDSAILWKGNDNQKDDPVDIIIGKYCFSLKEDSFILENMGLYKLLNCFTGSNYKERHIFKDYALSDYQNWFLVTWNEMLKIVKENSIWNYENLKKHKRANITVSDSNVIFKYYQKGIMLKESILPINCTLELFEKHTSSKTREEVFSKFIKTELKNNSEYDDAKRECAITATKKLAEELEKNLNYTAGLPRFLRIHNSEYYYAKTTNTGTVIYKVPALDDFANNIIIDSIVPYVPDKQANILTTIKNIKTGKELVLRNECRFSHGQFNGTPEAKMYYESGGSLLTIYEEI